LLPVKETVFPVSFDIEDDIGGRRTVDTLDNRTADRKIAGDIDDEFSRRNNRCRRRSAWPLVRLSAR